MKKNSTPPIVQKKNVRHNYTPTEIAQLNVDFRQAYASVNAAEAEFESVKSLHKARIAEAESRMTALDASLQAGFDMRLLDCLVVLRPNDRKKDFYVLPNDKGSAEFILENLDAMIAEGLKPSITEDMTQDDFEQDLIRAEAAFDLRREIPLWDAGGDTGKIVVGRLGKRWYGAARLKVGHKFIEQRLDSEQRSYKDRHAAVRKTADFVLEWIEDSVGKDAVAGFAQGIAEAVKAEEGLVE